MSLPAISAALQDTVELIVKLTNADRHQAFTACQAGLAQASRERDDAAFIDIAIQYGLVIDQQGYPEASINTLYEALQLAQSYHQFSAEARLLNVIGRAVYTRAEYRRAMQAWAQCLEVAELAGDEISWIWAKVGIAQIYDALDDNETAVVLLQQALERSRPLNDATLLLNILLNLGVNQFHIQLYEPAMAAYQEAIALARGLNHVDDIGELLFRIAEIVLAQGQQDAALAYLEQAEALCLQAHHRWALANIHGVRGQILLLQHRTDDAQTQIEQGLSYAQQSSSGHIEMRLWQQLVQLGEYKNDAKLTLHAFRMANQLREQISPRNHQQQLSELEDLAGLRPSAGRVLLELANHPVLERCNREELAQLLCITAMQIFKTTTASYWEYRPESNDLINVWRNTQHCIGNDVQTLSDKLLRSLQQGDSVIAHNAQHHQQTWELYERVLQQQGIAALMMIPLRLNEGLRGVLMIESASTRNWNSDEVQYANQLAIIGTRALASIERQVFQADIARLNAQLQASNNELEARVVERTLELQKAMAHLIESEKLASLGNLVAGFAHELNTPLGNTLTAASTLLDKNQELLVQISAGQMKKTLLLQYLDDSSMIAELVERNARRASNLIANLKQVAVDTASSKQRVFNLRQIIEETIVTLSVNLKYRKIDIYNHVPANVELNSYPGSLEQVIGNFINNSLVHGFTMDEAGKISISASQINDTQIELRYQDNGCGIAESLKKKVFDPFFTTRFGQGGSGLGLYLVYSLVNGTLGGVLELQDAEPHGVLFILTLPINAPAEHHDTINLLRH